MVLREVGIALQAFTGHPGTAFVFAVLDTCEAAMEGLERLRAKFTIDLHPSRLASPTEGVRAHLSSLLLRCVAGRGRHSSSCRRRRCILFLCAGVVHSSPGSVRKAKSCRAVRHAAQLAPSPPPRLLPTFRPSAPLPPVRYSEDLEGVLLSYRNERVLTQAASIHPYFPFVRVEVAADVVLFRPCLGMRLGAQRRARAASRGGLHTRRQAAA